MSLRTFFKAAFGPRTRSVEERKMESTAHYNQQQISVTANALKEIVCTSADKHPKRARFADSTSLDLNGGGPAASEANLKRKTKESKKSSAGYASSSRLPSSRLPSPTLPSGDTLHREARTDLDRVQDDALRRILVGASASPTPRAPRRVVNAINRSEQAQPGRTIETSTGRTAGVTERASSRT